MSTTPKVRRGAIAATIRALFRTRVSAGLLVVLPIYITYLLVMFVFSIMRDSSQWLVEAYLTSEAGKWVREALRIDLQRIAARLGHDPSPAELFDHLPTYLQWGISIFSVLLTIFILYAIGLFAANMVGRRVIDFFEWALDRVPLVKTVYRSSKQILTTFTGEQSQSFQRVALAPFPDKSMRCVCFVTNSFRDTVTDDELCTIFIPTTPNPTTGYLQVIPRGELTEMPWSVEEGVRTIMSAGILTPQFITIVPNKDLPKDVLRQVKEAREQQEPVSMSEMLDAATDSGLQNPPDGDAPKNG